MSEKDGEQKTTTTTTIPTPRQEEMEGTEWYVDQIEECTQENLIAEGDSMETRQDKKTPKAFLENEVCPFSPQNERECHSGKRADTDGDDNALPEPELISQLEDAFKWGRELEKRIEDAIDNISLGSFNAGNEIRHTFRELHERLNAEEVKVMEELESAHLRVEEPLQRTLYKLKEAFEHGDDLDLESLNKKDEMSAESFLREIEDLLNTTLADLKVSWDPETRKLSYTEHLINGVPIPNGITLYSIYNKSADISWECENSGLKEEDRENLVFHVEARIKKTRTKTEKEGPTKDREENNPWKEVYSGTENRHAIHGLEVDTEYDVRVKCSIRDLDGRWSKVESFRTENTQISSVILEGEKDEETFCSKLFEWCGSTDFDLLYRGTRDGFNASEFHRTCDNQGKTLVLIKNKSGHAFGGFSTTSWRHSASFANKQAPGSFLFTLTNIYGIGPTKFPLMDEDDRCAICHYNDTYGALFGESGFDLGISTDCDRNISSWSSFPYDYYDSTGKGGNIFSSNPKMINFGVQEIEVFRVNTP